MDSNSWSLAFRNIYSFNYNVQNSTNSIVIVEKLRSQIETIIRLNGFNRKTFKKWNEQKRRVK